MIDPGAYWFLLPIGVVISTLYTSTGISGANFWAPVYLLLLGLDPRVAFWLALVSMLFGSLSGLIRHARQGTIRMGPARKYLRTSVPAAIAGALVVPWVSPRALLLVFGAFVLAYACVSLVRFAVARQTEPATHETIHYELGALGGLITGLVSVGLGKLILPHCLTHRQIRSPAEAAGTVLVIVFVTSLVAVGVRLSPTLLEALRDELPTVLGAMLWVVPGVLLGGQVGPRLVFRLPARLMPLYVGLLLLVVGAMVLLRAVSS